jgi:limonene-1,2-epoxide hydrolase
MTEHPFIASRRAFLATTASAAALATFTKPQEAKAAALSDVEAASAKVVQDFCDAWATRDAEKIGSYLAEDASFRMIESSDRKEGRESIMEGIKKFLGTMKIAEFAVLRSSVLGNTVINDRIDRFENAEKKMEFHISGFFYVADGKIKEWQDYTWPEVD